MGAAVRFLMRTFSMFALYVTFICGVAALAIANSHLRRLAVRRKLEDARYCRRWRRSHALCCHWRWGR